MRSTLLALMGAAFLAGCGAMSQQPASSRGAITTAEHWVQGVSAADGKLAWLERGRVDPSSRMARSPAGLDAHSVLGTMIAAAPTIDDSWLASCREVAPRSGDAALTRLPGLLVARYRGDSSAAARLYFVELWKRLRLPLMGREPVEPRIWRT